MRYTQLALLALTAVLALDWLVFRTKLTRRPVFWVSYSIIVFFQLVTNGVLTGFEIVTYNGESIIGSQDVQFIGDGRLAFAPVEDVLFGFCIVLLTLDLWVWWGKRGIQREPMAGPPRWRD